MIIELHQTRKYIAGIDGCACIEGISHGAVDVAQGVILRLLQGGKEAAQQVADVCLGCVQHRLYGRVRSFSGEPCFEVGTADVIDAAGGMEATESG